MRFGRLMLLCLLALSLACPAFAQAAPHPLQEEELSAFIRSLAERAVRDGVTLVPSEEGFMAEGIGYSVYFTSDDLSPDAVVSAGEINMDSLHESGLTGPRGIGAAGSLTELLAAYPSDNPTLAGTMEGAVLYIAGQLPGTVAIGQVVRAGQEVQIVEHILYRPQGEGYAREGLQYLLQDSAVTGIRYFGGSEVLTLQQAQDALASAAQLQESDAYFSYDMVPPSPLSREDLAFGGLDFLDVTPEDALARLGEAVHEERVKDSNGEEIRVMQWDGIEIAFIYTQAGQFSHADRITVTGPFVEGPRGLRVGTSLTAALRPFPNEGEAGNPQALYGDSASDALPFGLLETQGPQARLYFALAQGGQRVLVSALFEDNTLVEMSASY